MMAKWKLAIAAAAFASAVSPAVAQDACLRLGEINTWRVLSDKALIVEDNQHRKFRLSMIGTCYDLDSHQALAFRHIGVGLRVSCVGIGDQVIQHDMASSNSRCSVVKIETYTPEMEAADRAARGGKPLWP